MIRRLLTLALVAVPLAQLGCASSPCSTGWSFQVGKPASVSTQTVLGPTVQTYAGQGLASGPLSGEIAQLVKDVAVAAGPALLPMPTATRPIMAATPQGCTLQDVCNKLDSLAASVNKLANYRPMPGGED